MLQLIHILNSHIHHNRHRFNLNVVDNNYFSKESFISHK